MELPFRKALQRQWPDHKLALHTTDITKTATREEMAQATTKEIQDVLSKEVTPERYPEIFYTGQDLILWLPDDKSSYHNFIKHIPKLLHITQAPIYCIATRTIDNPAAGTMAFMDLLDESKPPWWQHPPQELLELTPIHPRIRVLKQSAEGTSRELEQQAFILTFNTGIASPQGNFPDIKNPWYWMPHPDLIQPRMAPIFQIDTTAQNADTIQTRLQDQTLPSTNVLGARRSQCTDQDSHTGQSFTGFPSKGSYPT